MNLKAEALAQGLTEEEFGKIVRLLGREPNSVELGIFAVMWSEHCSYKTTKVHLRKLPSKNRFVVQGPGENAGIVDIGGGTCIAFKVESHNHPSFIEPFQGAATGVGGILRDIFTMGARPIAVLDSLHFGDTQEPRTSFLFHGVVGGISHYGNCMGIPTVGGEIHFDSAYNGNILVNAMAVGVVKKENIHKAKAEGEGNWVVYLGSKTGKDGIHGATMASEEFDDESEEKRPTVQVGDPFMEKLLMEATLEILEKNLVVGIQDMGAAGISCSTFEMSFKSNSGMEIHLDDVPLREKNTNAYEIFLSESQERMLLVVEPKHFEAVLEIAKKWDVPCCKIGHVTQTGRVRAFHHGKMVVDLPVDAVCDGFIEFNRNWILPTTFDKTIHTNHVKLSSIQDTLERLLSSPNLSSRSAVYEQYDYTVGADTVIGPGADAAVLRIKDTGQKIAVSLDSNHHYCFSDAYLGTCHTIAESVRNLACVGARAIGLTNCLNFGNPQEPETMGHIAQSIRAIGDCAKHFDTPVTGGNVSLYNQTHSKNIHPTPTIGMLGIVQGNTNVKSYFPAEGLNVMVVGKLCEDHIYQSEFANVVLNEKELKTPPLSLSKESSLQEFLLSGIDQNLIVSAHDCSAGGLVQALAEMVDHRDGVGVRVQIPQNVSIIAALFGEYASRCVIACHDANIESLRTLAETHELDITLLGKSMGDHLEIKELCLLSKDRIHTLRNQFLRQL